MLNLFNNHFPEKKYFYLDLNRCKYISMSFLILTSTLKHGFQCIFIKYKFKTKIC